ncbi:hypothetical protein CR513_20163, partial [Mucuna pruriens]
MLKIESELNQAQVTLVLKVEPKNLEEALLDDKWILAMQEELDQFQKNDVWKLVSPPNDKFIIGTKWIFMNKMDENGKVVRNKSRLEAIRIWLSFAAHHNMRLHSIDALYGLKQAPHAWYENLSSFLMTNGFQRGKVVITLFRKNYYSHFIIQAEDEIYIHQTKDVKELLKKFNLKDCKTMSTLMHLTSILSMDKMDKKGYDWLSTLLTTSGLDIIFSVCLCVRFQSNPRESHLIIVKCIFRYLKGIANIGLCYKKSDQYKLKGYNDVVFARDKIERKNISGGCHFIGANLVSWSSKRQGSIAFSTA